MGTLWELALDVLLPRACAHCRRDLSRADGPLCARCARELPPPADPACVRCGGTRGAAPFCASCRKGPFACRLIRAHASHAGAAASLVHAFKFRGNRRAALEAGRRMALSLALRPELRGFDALCPVPAHPSRERERGWNQAEILAREIAAKTGIPLLTILERTRKGAPAWTLGRLERSTELAGAFRARGTAHGRKILIIDDVAATGTTLEACARAARQAGAADAAAYVFARAGSAT
ncbi:MAG: double zinc ribbon domain-containing protein [Elusimicrobiota bacterium]|nr:MAG: double zinc ribbon domain-containing protein [Elusimicrobiota bacterium]